MLRVFVITALLLLVQACTSNSPSRDPFDGKDTTVLAGNDFYAYANGEWTKKTEIPSDKASAGVSEELQELANKRTADVIRDVAKDTATGSSERKRIADYYASYMDENAIEAKGLQPLKEELDALAAIKTKIDLANAIGKSLRADVDILNATNTYTPNLFGLWVAQDLDEPTRYSAFLLQGGLGMPDRDYYTDPSPKMAESRNAYRKHVESILSLAGETDASQKADRIFALEMEIAKVHSSRAETDDVQKGNNHWSRADFDTKAPGLDWASFFKASALDTEKTFVVWQPAAFIGISRLVKSESLDTWKDYLRFHLINYNANYLPSRFVNASFNFYGKQLSGTPALSERWKRAINATNAALGEAVGKLYVEKYFTESDKKRAEQLVKNLITAFNKRIEALSWMTPATKEKAKEKLATLKVGVGYPNKWRDYSTLEVVKGDALGNRRRAQRFEYQRNLKKLGQPIDREEWVMNPQLVNAVNLPVMNAIQFPAAILQPPFFGSTRSDAMNYGAIGAVIGHEISHSFDSTGALFDSTGKLNNWWSKDDLEHFKASSAALARQYDTYKPFPDLAIRGEQTLAESIADLAGLAAAFDAFKLALTQTKAENISGFTPEQQFFVSYAQSWREKTREPALRQQIITDGHAPAQYRVYTVRNLDAWYDAFGVKPGEKFYLAPAQRLRIW